MGEGRTTARDVLVEAGLLPHDMPAKVPVQTAETERTNV
jgi:hypothetical protein